jgi:hypothetical protein
MLRPPPGLRVNALDKGSSSGGLTDLAQPGLEVRFVGAVERQCEEE